MALAEKPEGWLVSDRYRVEELLGQGGMADVYKAMDTRLNRTVAIKMMRTSLGAGSGFLDQIRREATIVRALHHPAIVAVYDFGEHHPQGVTGQVGAYLVMEYVPGRTLREILREDPGSISTTRALEVMLDVLGALDYSHQAGVIHRDVNPGNVMITPDGDVKVTDFGLARAVSEVATQITAMVIGTAQYLSPEQVRGEPAEERSDIYAAGCMLYEMLAGRTPFVGDSAVSVAYQHVREEPDPPSRYNPDLSPQLDAIVMRSIAKAIADRYPSAADMSKDIADYLDGKSLNVDQPQSEDAPATPIVHETRHALAPIDTIPDVDTIGRGPLIDHLADLIGQLIIGSRSDVSTPSTLVIGVDAPWGTGKTTLVHLLEQELDARAAIVGKPLIVQFDAWRESKVGPEWWALGSTIYRGVRRRRAFAARIAMTAWSALGRLLRSKVFVGAVALLALIAVFMADADHQALVTRWQVAITAVTGAVAAAFGVSRLLFWSSPALGALYQKSEDAPLAEIAAMISRQRRWSPRSTKSQAIVDNLLGAWCLLLACIGLWLVYNGGRGWLDFEVVACGVLVLFGLGAYAAYAIQISWHFKRPILLIVDDLDRCTDEKTVAYLETIHTLIRHHEPPRLWKWWRQPAPLIVISLADGRWIRNAFAKTYETFEDVSGDETRGLGADFIQKLFDHTVIIPELTLTQASEYVRQMTGSDADQSDGGEGPTGHSSVERKEAAQAAQGIVEVSAAANLDQLERAAQLFPAMEAEALRSAISNERSTPDYVRALSRHLMTKYSEFMPNNPRMIKRVANAWSMLQAVQRSIGSQRTEQELVAAAIFMTKYPNLLDQLLHHPIVPADEGVWRRTDVLATRSLGLGPPPSLVELAGCFGKTLLDESPGGTDREADEPQTVVPEG